MSEKILPLGKKMCDVIDKCASIKGSAEMIRNLMRPDLVRGEEGEKLCKQLDNYVDSIRNVVAEYKRRYIKG